MKVVVVLPSYNAARTLRKTWEAIPKHCADEIILVDDASTDGTAEIAEGIAGLHVIRHPENRGYGANQKTCYDAALERGADIVVMLHADFQYDPSRVPHMVAPIAAGNADMVIGSRFLGGDPRADGMAWWRYYGNRFLTTLQNSVLNTRLSECHSGYRAYSRALLESIPYQHFSDQFAFDSQMISAAARRAFTITEVAIPVRYLSDSSSISFTRSVRYGASTLLTLLPK